MADWPTGVDLAQWIGTSTQADRPLLDRVLVAAKEDILKNVTPAIVQGVDPTYPVTCPASLFEANLIGAARILVRRNSQDGVIGAGELAIRVGRYDPDYDKIIRSFRAVDA